MKVKHILFGILMLLLLAVLYWLSLVLRVSIRMTDDMDLGNHYVYSSDAQCLAFDRRVVLAPIEANGINYDDSYIILHVRHDFRDSLYVIVRKIDLNKDSLDCSNIIETFKTREEFDSALAKNNIYLQLKPLYDP